MSHIFLSHVEKDLAIMEQIAQGLEAAGYCTWYFERDVLAGTSYLIQITHALENCDAIVLIASPDACGSDQVTKEVVGAFERGKPFFPVLINMTPPELKECQPEWRHALGGTAMITVGPEGLPVAISRIIDGLKAKRVQPEGAVTTQVHPIPGKAPVTPGSTEGERKNVTVMFADISGFSAMSEKMDPEVVTDIMNECFHMMEASIEEHGGTIDKFMGDCVMALFGAPKALEDAPHRAIETALEMRDRLLRYNEDKHLPIPLSFHIGINTGPVIAGMVGGEKRQDFTVMGDTVNLASRIERTAETGNILVAEDTYRLTEGYFNFEPMGEVRVKGKEQPVKTYKVRGPRRTITRVEACLEKGLSPFVGRTVELQILGQCFGQAREGHGQIVGLVGEPGVGKSRLVSRFRESLLAEDFSVIAGGCVHYGDAIPYLPILDMLKDYFDISEDEDETTIKKKINEKVAQLSGQLFHIISPLYEVLSLKVDDEEYVKLDAKQRHDRVFEAIRLLLITQCQKKPFIIIIEDLHWIDKTSEEFLTYFINSLATSRILLVLLYRPEYTPSWVGKTYYSQIRVDQLPKMTIADLVRGILRCSAVEPELIEFIANRTEGNPLFIEEMTYNLLENGSIKKEEEKYLLYFKPSDIQVPATIQGIIAARLDRLEGTLKGIMQTASVIGREFAFRVLQAVTSLREDLKSSLLTLQDLEFIYEKNLFPELEYIFKHALTREVTYNSLLIKKRKETHERVARALEEIYADRLEEFYEMLAYHYSLSNDSPKAYQYLKLSGDKASKNYSNREAVRFYKEALTILDSRFDNEESRREKIQLLLLLQIPLFLLGFPDDSIEILQSTERLAQELGDERALANVHRGLSLYHNFKGNLSLAVDYAENCFYEAEKLEEIELMTQSADQLCFAYYSTGDSWKAVDIAQRTLRLFEDHHLRMDLSTGGLNVYSLLSAWYGSALSQVGRFKEAKMVLENGILNAYKFHDKFEIGHGEFSLAIQAFLEGDGNALVKHAGEAVQYWGGETATIQTGFTLSILGTGYFLRGDYETARDYAEKGLSTQRELSSDMFNAWCNIFLSFILLNEGDLIRAKECAEDCLKIAREIKARQMEAFSYGVLGCITGKADPYNIDEAQQYIQQEIMISEELKLKPQATIGYLFLGELFADAGRKKEALENLKKAELMYLELKVTPKSYWLKRMQEALAKLESIQ